MKSIFTLLFIASCFITTVHAQAPQSTSYQAVVRDANGDPRPGTLVRFQIYVESANGATVYYREEQSATTDALGGITLAIGSGAVLQGSFESIDWNTGQLRARIEMDPTGGTNFLPFGTTSLRSVPYSLFSEEAGSLSDDGEIDPGQISGDDADQGDVLIWNGVEWNPGPDQDEQTLSINGNQLSISNGNTVQLPTGSGGDQWGDQVVETNATLVGEGTASIPLQIARQGATTGQVLKWDGADWSPAADNGASYVAGNGIAINGNTISNTGDADANATNEIQTLSLNGNTLSLTNGGSVNLPSGGSYTAGTGINIAGNSISAQNTQEIWNASQLRSYNIIDQAPEEGQILKYIGTAGGWMPQNAPQTFWTASGSEIYFNDNVGLGTSNPISRLDIQNGYITLEDHNISQTSGGSMAFSGTVLPLSDDFRYCGLSNKRWVAVWAVNGMIQTSDQRDKKQIQTLKYGLDDIMKLRPVSYQWKNKPESGTKLGLIAQELEMVIPEVVANPHRTPELIDGEVPEEEIKLGVYYADLIPVLIKAIQEQQQMIDELQQEVASLKNN